MQPFPQHGMCFVCGNENPRSIGMEWFRCDDGTIQGTITLTEHQQGPPGHAHGGASAALVDEAMGFAVWAAGHRVVAVNLNVDYRRPVPLHQPITVHGAITAQQGKAIHAEGTITLRDGTCAVSATGIYVPAPELLSSVDPGVFTS